MTTSSKLPDIPEFPSWTILPLVIAGIIAIEVYMKKLQDKMSANQNQAYFTGKLGCESRLPALLVSVCSDFFCSLVQTP